jgi:hypothetical protein
MPAFVMPMQVAVEAFFGPSYKREDFLEQNQRKTQSPKISSYWPLYKLKRSNAAI